MSLEGAEDTRLISARIADPKERARAMQEAIGLDAVSGK
jgi:hypothetical protein